MQKSFCFHQILYGKGLPLSYKPIDMGRKTLFMIVVLAGLGGSMLVSCNKKPDTELRPAYLQLHLPRHELKHGSYYRISSSERSIELQFSEVIDASTLDGNIIMRDKEGELTESVQVQCSGKQVLIMLQAGFSLQPGWKYEIHVLQGLRSIGGLSMPSGTIVECRTSIDHGPAQIPLAGNNKLQRNTIAIISDIHMGDPRAYNNNYCWFGKNREALESFLDFVRDSSNVKQLVILGDLFDEWLVPYTIAPYDSNADISDTREFFLAVAAAPINSAIFVKLREIAAHDSIELVYVPGNHDMLGTQQILEEIIPGVRWAGGPDGLGLYSPFPEMIFEHGHRYDFFNCPQPLVKPGHVLPPGYFISRLYAKGMMESAGSGKTGSATGSSIEFRAAWDIAYYYCIAHFMMDLPDANAANIRMGGIDNYEEPFSFHAAKEMYAADIEDYWPATQVLNAVPVPTPCCFQAIWNGHSDMFSAAARQYLDQPPAPKAYKISAFGHTHQPMLEVFPGGSGFTGIYANSGSWIDEDQSSHKVRTFLLISPKAWTGSALDVVGLYQYNPGMDNAYKAVLLAEESIE
jgi:UDP-2,3-diacylglucosamine pyrophosphatase LpxH